ncbi:polysaccharide pyruvyl transferase family protein [Raoultella planticola]|uniref:polysaccharide pyruvyl transferase family protein n=1 Tax=Raoultella planticola TaxID=575 RepID=UPI00388F3769
MKINYFDSKLNFGDELNSWLWSHFINDIESNKEFDALVPVGSLLCTWFLDRVKGKKTIIFSSGAGYGDLVDLQNGDFHVFGVRGKLTAKAFNLPETMAIGDGAALLSLVPDKEYFVSDSCGDDEKKIIFIPHHESLDDFDWEVMCSELGIEFVDPRNTSKYVASKIKNAKLVLAEAMHGAIFSDALRVPWIPVVTNHRINTFKWLDWLSMYNLPFRPIYLGSPSFLLECENKLRIKSNMALFSFCNDISFYEKNIFSNVNENKLKKITISCVNKSIRCSYNLIGKSEKLRYNKVKKLMWDATMLEGYLSHESVFNERVNGLKEKLNELADLLHR